MSRLLATFFLALSSLILAAQTPRTPVLVELFTSEGCSSCPPADRLLAALDAQQPVSNAQIVVLSEHVDYWDQLGWHDRFSSSQFTERQNLYAPRLHFDSPYTPQIVIDGSSQFVGSDSAHILASIAQSARQTKIPLTLSSASITGQRISASISAEENVSLQHGDLYAALIEPSAFTDVRTGENGGHRLNHVSVVRSFQRIGKLQDLSKGPHAFTLAAPSGTAPSTMKLIVFAQLPDQGAIRGVAVANLSAKP